MSDLDTLFRIFDAAANDPAQCGECSVEDEMRGLAAVLAEVRARATSAEACRRLVSRVDAEHVEMDSVSPAITAAIDYAMGPAAGKTSDATPPAHDPPTAVDLADVVDHVMQACGVDDLTARGMLGVAMARLRRPRSLAPLIRLRDTIETGAPAMRVIDAVIAAALGSGSKPPTIGGSHGADQQVRESEVQAMAQAGSATTGQTTSEEVAGVEPATSVPGVQLTPDPSEPTDAEVEAACRTFDAQNGLRFPDRIRAALRASLRTYRRAPAVAPVALTAEDRERLAQRVYGRIGAHPWDELTNASQDIWRETVTECFTLGAEAMAAAVDRFADVPHSLAEARASLKLPPPAPVVAAFDDAGVEELSVVYLKAAGLLQAHHRTGLKAVATAAAEAMKDALIREGAFINDAQVAEARKALRIPTPTPENPPSPSFREAVARILCNTFWGDDRWSTYEQDGGKSKWGQVADAAIAVMARRFESAEAVEAFDSVYVEACRLARTKEQIGEAVRAGLQSAARAALGEVEAGEVPPGSLGPLGAMTLRAEKAEADLRAAMEEVDHVSRLNITRTKERDEARAERDAAMAQVVDLTSRAQDADGVHAELDRLGYRKGPRSAALRLRECAPPTVIPPEAQQYADAIAERDAARAMYQGTLERGRGVPAEVRRLVEAVVAYADVAKHVVHSEREIEPWSAMMRALPGANRVLADALAQPAPAEPPPDAGVRIVDESWLREWPENPFVGPRGEAWVESMQRKIDWLIEAREVAALRKAGR